MGADEMLKTIDDAIFTFLKIKEAVKIMEAKRQAYSLSDSEYMKGKAFAMGRAIELITEAMKGGD